MHADMRGPRSLPSIGQHFNGGRGSSKASPVQYFQLRYKDWTRLFYSISKNLLKLFVVQMFGGKNFSHKNPSHVNDFRSNKIEMFLVRKCEA